jgi:hypothetical protein
VCVVVVVVVQADNPFKSFLKTMLDTQGVGKSRWHHPDTMIV